MSVETIDLDFCEIRYQSIFNVFQGQITHENRVTIYNKLTDEEFVVNDNHPIVQKIKDKYIKETMNYDLPKMLKEAVAQDVKTNKCRW